MTDKVSNTMLGATVSPRPLWTGFKTSLKIAYLASSGWSKEGEQFFQTMERNVKSRSKDETAELTEIWFKHFRSNYKTLIQPENESPPPIGGPDDECVLVPEVDFETDSEINELESITGHLAGGRTKGGLEMEWKAMVMIWK